MMDFMPGGEREEVDPIFASPLACTSHLPVQWDLSGTVAGARGVSCSEASTARDDWKLNSVLEVLSVSKGHWYVAFVLQVHPGESESQMLTVRFWDESNEAKQKNVARDEASLARLGTHTGGRLPPGFQTQASQSRPGGSSFFDTATGVKYSSAEIAWNVHFLRLRDGPPLQPPPEEGGEEAPVPRRSPAAIAAGLAVDVSPMSKKLHAAKPEAAARAPASESEDVGEQRWDDAKAEFMAKLSRESEAPRSSPQLQPSAADLDAKVQRGRGQAPRGCPTFQRRGTFAPCHLDDLAPPPSMPNLAPPGRVQKSAPAFAGISAASLPSGLGMHR